jgi:hypothetical protein
MPGYHRHFTKHLRYPQFWHGYRFIHPSALFIGTFHSVCRSRNTGLCHSPRTSDICIPAGWFWLGFGPRASWCLLAACSLPSTTRTDISKLERAVQAGRGTRQLATVHSAEHSFRSPVIKQGTGETSCVAALFTNKTRSTWRTDVIPPIIQQERRKARKKTGHKRFITSSSTGANTCIITTITIGRNTRTTSTCPRASSIR